MSVYAKYDFDLDPELNNGWGQSFSLWFNAQLNVLSILQESPVVENKTIICGSETFAFQMMRTYPIRS